MKKKIIVAPLNWGLGHATRCIPIIEALINHNFTPIIASDGSPLRLLRKEFPHLPFIELPSYNITYAQNGKLFKLKLLKDSPAILKAIKEENKIISRTLEDTNIVGIISDNRFGVRNKKVPSVFITHQLNVLSGNTSWLSTKIHQNFIKKFDICWVPDVQEDPNLSGQLGHDSSIGIPIKYIGPLSRFTPKTIAIKNDIMVLLSGPEPQRTLLEEKLLSELNAYSGNVIFVKGVIEDQQTISSVNNISVYNYMTSELLEKTIQESELIIARSGYTTIMDLAKLNKKAFFIPTPGQFEQEYLAKRLTEMRLVPSAKQKEFTLKKLNDVNSYYGLKSIDTTIDFKTLLNLF
ncbi:glycosyltransferase [Algibacter mikhailovii]|uniref:glycosyltransferase n=1 Tax=Algibacter mikhailovii TaxID=425498 RepID=UPI002493F7ED|nr:glycosyltransferase [Algibacter mikhailovii]